MKRLGLIFFLTGVLSICANAQDWNVLEAFKNVNEHYQNLDAFSLKFKMEYFDRNNQSVYEQKGEVVHSEKLHYTSTGDRIDLITTENYVSVNTTDKLIVFNEHEADKKRKKEKDNAIDISAMLDSLWAVQNTLKFRLIQSPKNSLRVFIEDLENPHFNAYEILISTDSWKLLEFKYYLKPTNDPDELSQIKISYSNETSRPKLKAPKLKVGYYLKKSKNKLVATDQFENYQIIDQTKIK